MKKERNLSEALKRLASRIDERVPRPIFYVIIPFVV